MGLTTSREAIERHASPVAMEAEPAPAYLLEETAPGRQPNVQAVAEGTIDDRSSNRKKADSAGRGRQKKRAKLAGGVKRDRVMVAARSPASNKLVSKNIAWKSAPKRGRPKKTVAKQADQPNGYPEADADAERPTTARHEASAGIEPPPMNAHRAKIQVAKKALAAIKEGSRIYIKSGEGNGGDTWWDSGVIRKIHERGKPFEIEWQKHNNRGEEVDTAVEKRIMLPVTYSLAGVAAEAIRKATPGTEAAAFARKSVLAEARIGSWCIEFPDEPWGMLDPFGEDSSTV